MISSDIPAYSSGESVGSSISLVVLSDSETGITVASPAGALDMIAHLNSKSGSLEDPPSSDHAPVAPDILPFLSDDHTESEPLEDSSEKDAPEPHKATIARWRAIVASRSLSLSSSASTPPASLPIVHALLGLPR
nr:hypothetical protein [Tanacetum cinerariifolium]